MAGEWRTVRLKDVVEINPDAIGSDWPYPHIKYVDISSVGEGLIVEPPQWTRLSDAPSRAKRLVRKGNTVLSTVRPNRRAMFFASQPEPDLVVSTGFAVLRPRKEKIEPRYLYTCVFDKRFTGYLISREKGAAYPAVLPEDIIAEATIKSPPRPEQRAIAHILGTLDDKIELNRKMNETLEAVAKAIFKSWFVDFDPVYAKRRGDPAGRPQTGDSSNRPYMTPEILSLFPNSFQDSPLGKIPRGWRVTALPEVVDINPFRHFLKAKSLHILICRTCRHRVTDPSIGSTDLSVLV